MASASISATAAGSGNVREEKNRQEQLNKYAEQLAKREYEIRLKYEKQLQKAKKKGVEDINEFEADLAKKQEDEIKALKEQSAQQALEYQKMLDEQAAKEELEKAKKMEKELAEYKKQQNSKIAQANQKATELADKINNNKVAAQAVQAAKAIGGAIADGAEKYMGLYSQYMSKIDARIQGAGKNFNFASITDIFNKNLAANPFIKYNTAVENLSKLVEAGVADNVVQRAFLASISDKIATTFDVMDKNLLRLVRIQQNDSTAARLGMEASLTRLFNYYFSDTSYLSDSFDTVSESLLDLSAQLDDKSAVELEYIVQKWLGALGSVGVSSNVLSTIAEGISYLGTGNVDALSSNEALQNLLVMSANRIGLDYGEALTGGVNAGQVNALLQSVISYVQEIASSNNNVVKQQYANLFGISITDMKAFQNLSDEVITDLFKSGMTYSDTLSELNDQLGQVAKRTHISEMIDNVMDNIMAATGVQIASIPGIYGTYKAFDMLEGITGGIKLPFISALGTGIDLNMSLEGLAKTGILGISTAAALISGIGNLFQGTGMLGEFNALGQNSRWYTGLDKGGGFQGYQNVGQLSTTKSTTNYVSSGNELGIQQSLSDTQKQTGEEVTGEASEEGEENTKLILEILKFIKAYYEGDSSESPLHVVMDNYGLRTAGIDDNGITFSSYPRTVI